MMTTPTAPDRYRALVRALWTARDAAPDGHLSQDEEADRAEALNDVWEQMTATEQQAVEKELTTSSRLA